MDQTCSWKGLRQPAQVGANINEGSLRRSVFVGPSTMYNPDKVVRNRVWMIEDLVLLSGQMQFGKIFPGYRLIKESEMSVCGS